MKIGYARVSTVEQNEARQMEALREEGVDKRQCRISEAAWSQSTSELHIFPWITLIGKRDGPTSGGTIRELTGTPKAVFSMQHL